MDNLLSIKDALRYYGGDTRIRDQSGRLTNVRQQSDALLGDEKIYRTLNALLYPGIENEKERILIEGHVLNPAAVLRFSETFEVIRRIYSAMNCSEWKHNDVVCCRRIERSSAERYLKRGFLPSFYSTSTGPYRREYADKAKIILLEFVLCPETPYVDFSRALGSEYLKAREQEVLLPPFLPVELEERKMEGQELFIRDMHGNPPVKKYIVHVKKGQFHEMLNTREIKLPWEWLVDKKRLEMVAGALELMNQKEIWSGKEIENYIEWKRVMQRLLHVQELK